MVVLNKIYTRTGDKGDTALGNGHRVPKDDLRVEAYGTVDEANATIGLVRLHTEGNVDALLSRVQNDLFDVGADLATPSASRWEGMRPVGDNAVNRLESWIDELNADLPPLTEFILPGGGPVGAFMHQGRTVCRRAERRVLTLMHEEPDVNEGVLRYLNRLSDWLFVAGRWGAKALGEEEYLWQRRQ